ncbi:unnamed protein product [Cyprideis torosa]|uniref:Uncharacterized protein n=1 Tax=Cyprideis torosa TaxID=163714 RepID=A0A7R8WRT9_9CRUS|nr:unnamed protein product [Cyprideis torosa]CAG0904171.1 unnamed protein product [Cyprideis torosa]
MTLWREEEILAVSLQFMEGDGNMVWLNTGNRGGGMTLWREEEILADINLTEELRSFTINSVNRVYVDKTITLKRSYNQTLRDFEADGILTDFSSQPERARIQINEYVEQKTNNLIKDLFSPSDITRDTRLAIVNALYFKAAWETPFPTASTEKKIFKTATNQEVRIPFMTADSSFNYGKSKNLGAQILQIPYKNPEISFTVILPEEGVDLSGIEERLTTEVIDREESEMAFQRVWLSMPKFKLEEKTDLEDSLTKLGLAELFNEPGLRGITESNTPLKVSSFVHKAFISVDEKGTEAAAATGVAFTERISPPPFICNRPFIFFIRRKQEIVFIGRLSSP